MKTPTPNCSICGNKVEEKVNPADGKVYWNQGENAQPINNGRCCDSCAMKVVFPARMARHYQQQEHH